MFSAFVQLVFSIAVRVFLTLFEEPEIPPAFCDQVNLAETDLSLGYRMVSVR
jgi:hypothetical protein